MSARTLLVVLAALCWGLAGGIGGLLVNGGWDSLVVSFYRGAIGLVFVLVWLALRPHRSGLSCPRLWFWAAVAGLGVAGNFAFYFVSIAHANVAVAATLMYCAPVFVFIVSFLLRLEQPTTLKWIAMFGVLVGIVLLTQVYNASGSDITLIGIVAGLLAGLSYAVFIFGFKYATPHGSPQAVLSIAFAVLTALLVWPGEITQSVSALGSPDWPLFIGLGVLGAGLSFVLYVKGLNHTAPAVASIVAMVEPVTATLFGVTVLSENLDAWQMAGIALILTTVTTLSVAPSPRPSKTGWRKERSYSDNDQGTEPANRAKSASGFNVNRPAPVAFSGHRQAQDRSADRNSTSFQTPEAAGYTVRYSASHG